MIDQGYNQAIILTYLYLDLFFRRRKFTTHTNKNINKMRGIIKKGTDIRQGLLPREDVVRMGGEDGTRPRPCPVNHTTHINVA